MDEKIDEAIKKLMDMKRADFYSYECETMAEALAYKLVEAALDDGGFRAIQLITERTGGKVSINKKEKKDDSDIINKLRVLLDKD